MIGKVVNGERAIFGSMKGIEHCRNIALYVYFGPSTRKEEAW